ncbi:MAG: Anaerobic glycerol-3-phosphate dehydrogenase subunit C [Syntrophorhabdaceae bacterium PtaU1.Bin034]|nr:MAG: Anaerobic glycerol-3-phosphate dehydrogenase subunit C [Syntrophorhabdaceae bacterium PtaU1.Bin034]
METLAPFKEVIDEVRDKGGDAVKFCYQCGKCDTVCPWNRVRKFSMRKLIREATFGLSEIEKEEIWRCTTCGKCPQRCPRDVRQIDDMVALRRMATGYGVFPTHVKPYRAVASGLSAQGNPFNEDRKTRADWAEGLNVKPYAEGMDILYFPCCYSSYDPRLKKVAQATARILNKAHIDYGILGAKENCCGESIRKTGNEEVFRKLAKENIKTFIDHGVKKILVTSPHCYHTFKNEYPQFKVNFEVIHITQYLSELLSTGKLTLTKGYDKKVIYHDPCYMGRHNNIYDEPREVLSRIPGLELHEFSESREDALCCGMGGGRIWAETLKDERFVNLRTEEAVALGAQEVVTACPYCVTNFEDSRAVLNYSETIEVKDITEIIQEVM